ncbi:MAG: hypothetical protein HOV80_39360 [Polyangiaceae bacterium]|nr:hypothetical protein [Polyangiaceae bacterium]
MRGLYFASVIGLSMAALTACGDDDETGTGGGTTTSTVTSGTSTSSSTTATATSTTSSGTPSNITPDITTVNLSGSCKPVVPADPVFGSIDVTYDNAGEAAGELTIIDARLEFTGIDSTLTFTFDLDPPSSGMVGPLGSMGVPHTKVVDSGMGSSAESPCGFCSSPATLTVSWMDAVGGTAQDSYEIASFPCAF